MASVVNPNLDFSKIRETGRTENSLCSQIEISSLSWTESSCYEIWKSQRINFQLLCAVLGAAFGWGIAPCCLLLRCHRSGHPRAACAKAFWHTGCTAACSAEVTQPCVLYQLALLSQDEYTHITYEKEQNSQTRHVILHLFHSRECTDAWAAVYTNVRMLPIVNWKLGCKDISTTSKTTHSSSEITFSGFRTSYLIIINDPIVQNTIRTCLRKRQRWHYFPGSLLIEIPPNRRIIWVEIYLEANNE